MKVHRFHSPFTHWLGGLLSEIAVIAGFLTLVALLVAVMVRVL